MTNNDFYSIFREYNIHYYCPGTHLGRNCYVKNHFLPLYSNKEVNKITGSDINKIFDEMERAGYMPNTLYGVYAALLSYFKFAEEQGEIDNNPMINARKFRPDL